MIWAGFAFSLFVWAVLSFGALKGTLYLHREKVLTEKWLLLVPFLITLLIFSLLRYSWAERFFTFEQVHQLFAIGAYKNADLYMAIVCIPLFYIISIMKPEWVVRFWVNVPLLVFLPFALKLAIYLSGLAPWDANPGSMQPTRVE